MVTEAGTTTTVMAAVTGIVIIGTVATGMVVTVIMDLEIVM